MNTPTRRSFLKASAALAATLPFAPAGLATSAGAPARSVPPAGGRPRPLLFDPADLPRIRANTALPRFASLWQEHTQADLAADSAFIAGARFNNHVQDFLRLRQILERTSFTYALTGDRAQLDVARQALAKTLAYPKWDYFLEAGKQVIGLQRAPEATIAVCFALDFLGDALSAEEVAEAERHVAEKGAPACFTSLYGMKYPDRVRGWGFDPEDTYPFRYDLRRWPLILNATNLKVIPLSALGIAACRLHGRHPMAEQWLDMARSSARSFATMYGTDGSFDEGISYWGYTTLHLALFAEVLWRRLGIDDRHLINYRGSVRYALAHTMPTKGEGFDPTTAPRNVAVPYLKFDPAYDIVNFGDALSTVDVSVAAWIARTHEDPVAQHVARETGEAKFHYGLVWFDPAAPATPPGDELLDLRLTNDLVISRTGWTVADTVLALRSGGPANHEHADRNSIIFKAHGERLFHDPFRAGYSPTIERWKLRQTSAHSAVLIAGQGHQYHDGSEGTNSSWSWAYVRDFRTGPGWMLVTSEATEAYQLVNPAVERVERTLLLLKPDVLLVLDRVRLGTPAPIQVRFQVFNDDQRGAATAQPDGFRITRPHASLHATVHSPGALQCSTGRLDLPPEDGIHPFAEVATAAAGTHEVLTVCSAAPAGEAHGQLRVRREGESWIVAGSHRGLAVNVTLRAPAGGLPTLAT